MPTSIIQSSFAGGEWAPSLYQRTDLARYSTAVRTMKNFVINPHGYIANRVGTYFITETQDSTKESRLIPFQFAAGDAYVLEVGHNYIRVMQSGGVIEAYATDWVDIIDSATYKWTDSGVALWGYYMELAAGGDPGLSKPRNIVEDADGARTTMTYTAGGGGVVPNLLPGWWSFHDMNGGIGFDTVFMRLTDDVDPDTKADGYCEGDYGTTIVTPYDEADIWKIKVVQRGDIMYFVHPSYAVYKLTRVTQTQWTFAAVTFGAGISAPANFAHSSGPGLNNNYVVTAVNDQDEESVASNEVTNKGPGSTFTWDAVTGAVYYNVYKDPYSCGLYGWIARATDLTFEEPRAGIDPDFSKGVPQAQTVFNAANAYPAACSFYQQRLILAGSNNEPQTVWGSVINSYDSFNISIPLADNDAFEFALTEINRIRWIATLRDLLIGTAGGEWRMSPSIEESTITPTNVIVKKESSWGCMDIHPLIIGDDLLFIDATKKAIRDFKSALTTEGKLEYKGSNLCIMANHLFENYLIIDWAYQQYPDSVVWVIRNDGTLLGLTYYPEQEILGWHQHETDGEFESVASILTTNGVFETYFIVKRTINGTDKRFVEYFPQRLPANDIYEEEIEDSFFVDCGLSYDEPITITAATKADPCQVTAAAHGLSTDDYIDITEVGGMTELNGNRYKVVRVDADNVTLKDEDGNAIDSTGYTTYTSGGKLREAVLTVTGLSHLNGEAVSVLADGVPVTGKTVSGGAITLSTRASRIHVGLAYTSELETMDLNFEMQRGGSSHDKVKDLSSVLIKLINSASLTIGPTSDDLSTVPFTAGEFFTGEKNIFIAPNAPDACRILARVTEPLPCQIVALVPKIEVSDY